MWCHVAGRTSGRDAGIFRNPGICASHEFSRLAVSYIKRLVQQSIFWFESFEELDSRCHLCEVVQPGQPQVFFHDSFAPGSVLFKPFLTVRFEGK